MSFPADPANNVVRVWTGLAANLPASPIDTSSGWAIYQQFCTVDPGNEKTFVAKPRILAGALVMDLVETTPGTIHGNVTVGGSLTVGGATVGNGGFFAPDNVAGEPSFSFVNSPTTGLRRIPGAPDSLNVEVSNVIVAQFLGNGNTLLHGNVILDPGKTVTAPGGVSAPNIQKEWQFGNTSSGNTPAARFLDPGFSDRTAPTNDNIKTPVSVKTAIDTLRLRSNTSPTMSGVTVDVLLNGNPLAPPLSLAIPAGMGPLNLVATVGTPTVAVPGDYVTLRVTKSGAGLGMDDLEAVISGVCIP